MKITIVEDRMIRQEVEYEIDEEKLSEKERKILYELEQNPKLYKFKDKIYEFINKAKTDKTIVETLDDKVNIEDVWYINSD